MNKIILSVIIFFTFISCAHINNEPILEPHKIYLPKTQTKNKPIPIEPIVMSNEDKILLIGKQMALVDKEIVRGGCWDYIDTLYKRAGFDRKDRTYIFRGKKNRSPYANINQIKPGDWLYFINHSYHNIEHSGIFVRWHDKNRFLAVILSYKGEYKNEPARYKVYNIKNTYTIIRAKK